MSNKSTSKIVLGKRPKSFNRTVECDMLEGGKGRITWLFNYMDRKEFSAFSDEIREARKMQINAEIDAIKKASESKSDMPEVTNAERNERDVAANIDYLMRAASGWDLDVPFDRPALEQLANEVPAAITAAISEYRDAIVEGRLGN